MTLNNFFLISMIIGWAGLMGYINEVAQGRIHRWTTWNEMTKRQWAFWYMILQFVAVLLVMLVTLLYLVFRG